MDNILIIKNYDYIMICENGKRLLVDINNKFFNILKDKEKEEIKQWYLSLRKGGEIDG